MNKSIYHVIFIVFIIFLAGCTPTPSTEVFNSPEALPTNKEISTLEPSPTITPTETSTPIPDGYFIYEVQQGDTIASIREKFQIDLLELTTINRLDPLGTNLRVGDKILIPEPKTEVAEASTSTSAPATEPTSVTTPTTGDLDIIVFYTNDEHGWMEGEDPGEGAANLVGLWDEEEVDPNDIVLVLSGGDNWTGPAISNWFDGESMVDVMNAMGYDASTIGNHEFDFGLDILQVRLAEASFPYLSANMRYKNNNKVPKDLGIDPYIIIDEGEVQLGIIGLTTSVTPDITMPAHVSKFDFINYEDALREYVPEMQSAGADLIFVISHVCTGELTKLSKRVEDLGISLMGGGHCHVQFANKVSDTVIISGGSNYVSYAYVRFAFDFETEQVVSSSYSWKYNIGGKPDEVAADVVSKWRKELEAELTTEIGYLEREIPKRNQAMQDLITETWLLGYPSADMSIYIIGGMQDRIPAGAVTLSHIISVLPFDNILFDVTLTGAELLQVIEGSVDLPALGGIHKSGSIWVLDKTGEPIDLEASYSVLVPDFMYYGGSGYDLLTVFDPDAYYTGIDCRQPLIEWISAQKSTPDNPLDSSIEGLAD